MPEVSLVAILDADKEGFLRNVRSLVQTIGRAARNSNGRVIMYADKITKSMQIAIDETNRRRSVQMEYNEKHGITPTTIFKSKAAIMEQTSVADSKSKKKKQYEYDKSMSVAADPVVSTMNKAQLEKMVKETQRRMEKAAKDLDFLEAARLRDEWQDLQQLLAEK